MAVGMKVHITGDKQLEKKFKDEKRIKKPMAKFLEIISREIKDQAAVNSPVETGTLQGSWAAKVLTHSNPMSAVISNDTIYALPLEFSGKRPRGSGIIPFFRPAINAVLNRLGNRGKQLGVDIEKEYKKR
jgi:hypothetical protein